MERKKKILFYDSTWYTNLDLRRREPVKLGSQVELVPPQNYVKGEHYDGAFIHTGTDGASTVLLDLIKNFPGIPIILDTSLAADKSIKFFETVKKIVYWNKTSHNISMRRTSYQQTFNGLIKRIKESGVVDKKINGNGAKLDKVEFEHGNAQPHSETRDKLREKLVGAGYQPEPIKAKPEVQARIDAQLNKWKIHRERKLARQSKGMPSRHLV